MKHADLVRLNRIRFFFFFRCVVFFKIFFVFFQRYDPPSMCSKHVNGFPTATARHGVASETATRPREDDSP